MSKEENEEETQWEGEQRRGRDKWGRQWEWKRGGKPIERRQWKVRKLEDNSLMVNNNEEKKELKTRMRMIMMRKTKRGRQWDGKN